MYDPQVLRGEFEVCEHIAEDSVVWGHEECGVGVYGDGAATGTDAGIDDYDVDGAGREVGEGPAKHVGGICDVLGGDVVADVDDGGVRVEAQDDTFHRCHVAILRAEIGGQSNQRAFAVSHGETVVCKTP